MLSAQHHTQHSVPSSKSFFVAVSEDFHELLIEVIELVGDLWINVAIVYISSYFDLILESIVKVQPARALDNPGRVVDLYLCD